MKRANRRRWAWLMTDECWLMSDDDCDDSMSKGTSSIYIKYDIYAGMQGETLDTAQAWRTSTPVRTPAAIRKEWSKNVSCLLDVCHVARLLFRQVHAPIMLSQSPHTRCICHTTWYTTPMLLHPHPWSMMVTSKQFWQVSILWSWS